MDVKGERIEVLPLTHDEAGNKIEPEQAPARRLLDVSDGITIGGQKTEKELPITVSVEMSAGELAVGLSEPCMGCKHFDPSAWKQYRRTLESTADGQRELNKMRWAIIGTGNAAIQARHAAPDGDTDVEHALAMLGVCHPLTDLLGDVTIVYPMATCPATLPQHPEPIPKCYAPKTGDDVRKRSFVFDSVMRAAQGRK
jgi:hypothetical protein